MKKLTLAILAVWLAMAGDVSAQSIPGGGTGAANIPEATFANAPSSPPVGTVRFFTDTNGSTCAGGGSTKLLCEWNGSAWVVVGNGTVTTTGGDVFGPASSVDG